MLFGYRRIPVSLSEGHPQKCIVRQPVIQACPEKGDKGVMFPVKGIMLHPYACYYLQPVSRRDIQLGISCKIQGGVPAVELRHDPAVILNQPQIQVNP